MRVNGMDLPEWLPNEAGLSSDAVAIIQQRHLLIDAFQSANPQWMTTLDKLAAWQLAIDLDLVAPTLYRAAATLNNRADSGGNVNTHSKEKLWTPDEVYILLLKLVASSPFRTRRMQWLSEQDYCSNETTQHAFLAMLERSEQDVVRLLRGMFIEYQSYGIFGLLKSSTYSCYDELIFVERWRTLVNKRMGGSGQSLIAQVRMDVWALVQTLKPLTRNNTNRRKYRKPMVSLWQQHMLHAPAMSQERQAYSAWFDKEQTDQIVHTLAQHRHSTDEQATNIWQRFLEGGLIAIVDSRLALQASNARSIRQDRYEKAIEYHTQGMRLSVQQEIRKQFSGLVKCAERHALIMPLLALIETLPSDRRRVQAGRRFWFGAGAIM